MVLLHVLCVFLLNNLFKRTKGIQETHVRINCNQFKLYILFMLKMLCLSMMYDLAFNTLEWRWLFRNTWTLSSVTCNYINLLHSFAKSANHEQRDWSCWCIFWQCSFCLRGWRGTNDSLVLLLLNTKIKLCILTSTFNYIVLIPSLKLKQASKVALN